MNVFLLVILLVILIVTVMLVYVLFSILYKEFVAIKSHSQAGYLESFFLCFIFTIFKILVSYQFFKLSDIIFLNSGGKIIGRGMMSDTFLLGTSSYGIYEGNSSLAALLAFAVYGLLVFLFFFILKKIFSIQLFTYNILFFIVFYIVFGINNPEQKTPYEKLIEKRRSEL